MSKKETIELLPAIRAPTPEQCAYREGKLFSEMVESTNLEEDTGDLALTSEKGPVKMYFVALRDFYAGITGSQPFASKFKDFCKEGCKHSLCKYHAKK